MISEIDDLPEGAQLDAEVGIVGAGFAGISLARQLAADGVRVVLLESGRREFDPEIQALARVESVGKPLRTPSPDSPFTPYLAPQFRGEFRVRQLGGTSNIWTGKWRAFDELDFAARDWVPASGWPITRDELAPYYDEVAREQGLGDAAAFEADPAVARAVDRLAAAGLKLSYHYWEATAARPGVTHRGELEGAPTLQVVLGANATELVLADDGETVGAVVFRALDGRTFRLRADRVVLATGGLESSRLLLASNRPAGVGNDHDLVGRFYMDHPKSKGAILRPGPALDLIEPWTRTRPRPRFHVSLSLADDVQRAEGVLGHALYLSPVHTYALDYPDAEVAALQDALRARRPLTAAAAGARLLRSPRALGKVISRRRHFDRGGPVAHYQASMYVEQAPNRDSRLTLAEETDALGLPRLRVDWQLNDLDRTSFTTTLRVLAERIERAGLGTLVFDPPEPSLDDWVDAAHHIGATRMGATPADGVVDRDGRVFGTTNLYVASSSVFPTGHSAAPTMTILAFARRLGAHLLDVRARADVP